jgi:hypothetical protein
MTDEARFYKEVGKEFASHEAVNHGEEEYVRYWNEVANETRPDGKPRVETTTIMTNTVGYYSRGVYQHCSEKHLHRGARHQAARRLSSGAHSRDPLARNDWAGSLTSTASAARAA